MANISWAELYGEEPEGTVGDWLVEASRQSELNKGRVFCRNCQDYIRRRDMKRWGKDDETVDLLCPGCDAVLVENV